MGMNTRVAIRMKEAAGASMRRCGMRHIIGGSGGSAVGPEAWSASEAGEKLSRQLLLREPPHQRFERFAVQRERAGVLGPG
jgi:hypothetical protein